MADIKNVDAFGDNPIVLWDDGDRIPLIRRGSLWVPQRKHVDKNSSGDTGGDSGSTSGGVTITAEMIKAGCDAGGYSNPTYHDQGGYAGVAAMFNDAISKTHSVNTKKQAACLVGECIQETGGMYYWTEAGGPFRYDPYRGRGYIQVTWKENYDAFGAWCKKYNVVSDAGTFTKNPESLATKAYVALTGIWEFDQKHGSQTLWQIADASSSPWSRVSRAINTGNPDSSFPAYAEGLRTKIINAVLAVTPDPKPAGGGSGSLAPKNDYPYPNDSWLSVDPWGFYKRECVSFACWRVRNKSKYSTFTNSWKTHWGNGGQWIAGARAAGIPVYSTPAVGDIACRTSGRAGHVAFVYSVEGGGKFHVEEYNHDWSNGFGHVYDTRACSTSTTGPNGFAGYIRFGVK